MAETDRLAELLKEREEDIAQGAIRNFRNCYKAIIERSDSPIERLLAGALVGDCIFHRGYIDVCIQRGDKVAPAPWEEIYFLHQVPIGDYTADFYFELKDYDQPPWARIVVECDGHDYHERTKEQARHDRRRDRWMQLNGIHVMRFTGSEIWNDPDGCSEQVFDLIVKLRADRRA